MAPSPAAGSAANEERELEDAELGPAPRLARDITFTKVTQEALRSLKFQDPSLLRGAPVSAVLRRRARILGDRAVKEKHYSASAPVDHLDAFISHNWATPRDRQFLALSLHFNLVPAIIVSTVVSCIAWALTVLGILPSIQEVFGNESLAVGVWCQITGMLTFGLMLVWGHTVQAFLPWREPVVFLDKLCVHQTDLELKRKGIEHLPAFLYYSWRMVVVYSDLYLQKLWTVYELATFLLLFPEGCLQVVPVSFPRAAIALTSLICLSRTVFAVYYLPATNAFLRARVDSTILTVAMFVPVVLGITLVCRRWARTQASIFAQVQSFSISKAACLDEDDRRLVERNVAAFARHFGLVGKRACEKEALGVFDTLVREHVPSLITASMGHVGFPYRHAAMMFAVYLPYALDSLAGEVLDGVLTPSTAIAAIMWSIAVVFGIGPLVVALCYMLSKRLLDVRGVAGVVAFLSVVSITFAAYAVGTLYVANPLYDLSRTSLTVSLGNCTFTATLVFITSRVYSRSRTIVPWREWGRSRSAMSHDSSSSLSFPPFVASENCSDHSSEEGGAPR